MNQDLHPQVFEGLERLCAGPSGNAILAAPAFPGIERIEAQFSGNAFEPHRHDTYALGVTLKGFRPSAIAASGASACRGR